MKTAVLTDLHANREALEAVLEHAAGQGVDGYALLGDFVGYGADPGWVVDRVRELVAAGAPAVQGNHDLATVEGASPEMRPEPRLVIEWTRSRLNAEQIGFLARLPLRQEAAQGKVLYVHANAWAPQDWGYILGRMDAMRSLHATRTRITFCGHVHEPRLYHLSRTGKAADFVPTPGVPIPLLPQRRWLVIPGSVGQPRDGDPAACYAIHDEAEGSLSFWRVPYDHESAAAKIRAAGLPPALAERLAHGI
jgi:diadenosine tetraphosphatase ApaH/serine/threonine PP2A family protein phosphatase